MSRTAARRRRPLLALLTSLVVGLGLVALPSSGAQAEPTTSTKLTVNLNRDFGVYYDTIGPDIAQDRVIISGRLTDATTGAGLADQTITLYRRLKTAAEYQPVRNVTTGPDGRYSVNQPVVGTAGYGVAYAGDGVTYAASESPAKGLGAMRDFNAGKRKVDGRLYFRGDINPYWGNRTIYLTKQACGTCARQTVATKQTGPGGGWSFRVYYPKKPGPVWRWQAVIKAEGNFERSYSGTLTTETVYGRGATKVATLR